MCMLEIREKKICEDSPLVHDANPTVTLAELQVSRVDMRETSRRASSTAALH